MEFETGDLVKIKKGHYEGYPVTSPYNLPKTPAFIVEGSTSQGYVILLFNGDKKSPPLAPSCLESAKPKSPIEEKMVLCRRVHYGEYGNLTIYESQGDLRIEFNKSKHTAEELEEAAHILVQVAEFLRSESK